MKKFMKAIAFVTVMCMALSTVAFATEGAILDETVDKQLNITVEGAGDEQVALLVVAAGTGTAGDPLYIDQKLATSGTALTFTAKIADTSVTAVDVYAGYGTYATANNSAKPVATNVSLTKAITEVTIVKTATDVITSNFTAQGQTGTGVAIKFDVKEAPAGVAATQMIWAIRYTDDEGAKVGYSESYDVKGYGIGTTLTTGIELGLAFLNGSESGLNKIAPVKITGVDVIFLFEGANSFSQEVFTNNADKKKPEN